MVVLFSAVGLGVWAFVFVFGVGVGVGVGSPECLLLAYWCMDLFGRCGIGAVNSCWMLMCRSRSLIGILVVGLLFL